MAKHRPARARKRTRGLASWGSSDVTFGPVGRILATVLLVLPILLAVFVNAFFVFVAALWLFIVPMAWRDIWARVPAESQPAPELPDIPASPVAEAADADAIATRAGAQRW